MTSKRKKLPTILVWAALGLVVGVVGHSAAQDAKPADAEGRVCIDVTDVLGKNLSAKVELRGPHVKEPICIMAPEGRAEKACPAGRYRAYTTVYTRGFPSVVDVKYIEVKAVEPTYVLVNVIEGTAGRRGLPTPLLPLVGREDELAAILGLLGDGDCRLLTLLGPGGMGKTRLAVEAAHRVSGEFAGGVGFVPLSGVDAADGAVSPIAEALGVSFRSGASAKEQLVDYLRGRELLLVLDGFEHLIEDARLVVELLAAAPGAKAMVTSRAKLDMPGERIYAVGGLHGPDTSADGRPGAAENGAVQLFLQGAQGARTDYQPAAEDLDAIARVCHHVEGMPLAILLAASWMGVLSPAEIAAELAGDSGHNIDFLAADWKGVPLRERNMRAVLDRSWSLLSAREQDALAPLSVFRASCTAQEAQTVSGARLADLRIWVSRSLLVRNGGGRFEMHDLMRQYLRDKLEERPELAEATRQRHAIHYL